MSDSFKEFVEEMARLTVPEDDTEESRARREAAASELGTPISELDDSDLLQTHIGVRRCGPACRALQ